jgi:hypothetical protein
MDYSIRKITNNCCLDTNKKVLQFFHFLFSEGSYTWIKLIVFFILFSSCSKDSDLPNENNGDNGTNTTGTIPPVVEPDVGLVEHGTKINQLVGDYDREKDQPTENRTFSRYGLEATDLGVPFQKGDTTFVLFGDSWGVIPDLPNAIAYTTDNTPDDGLELNFVENNSGLFHPLTIPGISQHAFEVPTEGITVNNRMYIYHTTDHSPVLTMGRSVLARSNGDGGRTFSYLYDMSVNRFINVSIVKRDLSDWDLLPEGSGDALVIFGSGKYRESPVFLAIQPASEIEDKNSIRYFAGIDGSKNPLWTENESSALPLFEMDEPCVGELSVSYNEFINRWILLYNCGNPRGINMRTSEYPWGPWSEPQVLFHPWDNNGYCHFMHTSWEFQQCDSIHDNGRENEWGGEYGPYQFENLAKGDSISTTIYFTMSTWNPYTVVLMKAKLKI